ncbi:alpha/beta hydrolase family protein [Nonomuraea fuscirosea]|uniref:Alpha/beta hydrolase family protein n=1 Tax=Nonomuraea fuscirosea TaxID=1291556 RepID=A0A2T0NBP5_9ACTN|nr:alpha/beta fold hydrolase [Nonomuraea fuscirosea]PRX70286.1 alpha/beta hydrolase family protein [Nonomuraea fuscirosea]
MIIRVVLALALSAPPVMTPAGPAPSACPVPVPARTSCAFLEVPERRDAPERKIQVGYAVHMSDAPGRRPDPIVYMSGGPGSASAQLIGFLGQMFPDRDVVTIEQRGSRYSRPALACPETAQALLGRLRQPPADVGAAAARCRERLGEQGVDLRGYNTKEIAADVAALRRELGYDTWNLFGVSYSTRVMLDAAAADPDGVRSLVLDSFLPEGAAWYDDRDRNLTDTMRRLGVADRFAAVRERLNRSPALVPTTDPLLGREFTARMSGDDVAAILAEAVQESDVAAVAPALVRALAQGRDELLTPLADAAGEGLTSHEFGLYHAVQCQDEVPFNTFTPASRLFTLNADKAVCDAWQLPKATPVNATTRAPVYVLGGSDDPTTPPRTARPAAEALPAARFQEFGGVSHAVFLASACARARIVAFVADPASYAVTACPEDPPVVRTGDLHVTAAPYRISRSPWLAAPFALFALVCLAQLVSGALRGRSLRAFAGLAGVAFTGLITESVLTLAARNETALAVGLPGLTGPYTWIAVASVVLGAAAFLHERKGRLLAAAVAGAGFLVWWFTWVL